MFRDRPPRQRVLKSGKIIFNQHYSVIDCMLRNRSPSGVALDIATPLGVPDRFLLRVSGERDRECEVVWRKPGRVGVKFVD